MKENMKIKTLNYKNFNMVSSKKGVVIIDCWAEWCGACKSFEPVFQKVAQKHSEHTFAKIDSTKHKELINELGIENIPTLMLYRDGILLFQQPGYFEEEKLEDILDQALNINMDEVRAHIADKKKYNN
jgi:thioredoxin 1